MLCSTGVDDLNFKSEVIVKGSWHDYSEERVNEVFDVSEKKEVENHIDKYLIDSGSTINASWRRRNVRIYGATRK
jgi:hypothetical protein